VPLAAPPIFVCGDCRQAFFKPDHEGRDGEDYCLNPDCRDPRRELGGSRGPGLSTARPPESPVLMKKRLGDRVRWFESGRGAVEDLIVPQSLVNRQGSSAGSETHAS
jgi:hypothetical protein